MLLHCAEYRKTFDIEYKDCIWLKLLRKKD